MKLTAVLAGTFLVLFLRTQSANWGAPAILSRIAPPRSDLSLRVSCKNKLTKLRKCASRVREDIAPPPLNNVKNKLHYWRMMASLSLRLIFFGSIQPTPGTNSQDCEFLSKLFNLVKIVKFRQNCEIWSKLCPPPCQPPCPPPCQHPCRTPCSPPCRPPCQLQCRPQCNLNALWGLIDADRVESVT